MERGLHGESAKGRKAMLKVQMDIADSDPLGAWIDTDDLKGGDEAKPQGDLHYPKEKAVTLCDRFARAALEQLQAKGHKP